MGLHDLYGDCTLQLLRWFNPRKKEETKEDGCGPEASGHCHRRDLLAAVFTVNQWAREDVL